MLFQVSGLGHIASDCPNRRIITLAEWDAIREEDKEDEQKEDEEEQQEDKQEEVIEAVDEGEMLVLRRVLSNQCGVKDEQRENIFHSSCTVEGKVCSLIIDGGSCPNVVSLRMIEKLGLQATAHSHPYNIQWLNQSKGLQVNSRCLISLSIGKNYQDELWCDVILIDACHILLGRPWMYDRKVMHNGFLNTYSFSRGGKKITLTPLSPSELSKHKLQKSSEISDMLFACSEPLLKASYHEFRAFREWISATQEEI